MKTFSKKQLQSVIDNYSVGKISSTYILKDTKLDYNDTIVNLSRLLIETNQGIYLLIFSDNSSLHSTWWELSQDSFASLLSGSNKIKNCKLLLNNSNVETVHKYDHRFSLFAL